MEQGCSCNRRRLLQSPLKGVSVSALKGPLGAGCCPAVARVAAAAPLHRRHFMHAHPPAERAGSLASHPCCKVLL